MMRVIGETLCENCCVTVYQKQGKKYVRFCSNKCRYEYWYNHIDENPNRKALCDYTCAECRKEFKANSSANRMYCSQECYRQARWSENGDKGNIPKAGQARGIKYGRHTKEKRDEFLRLREKNVSYNKISAILEIPRNTIKSWGRRYGTAIPKAERQYSTELPNAAFHYGKSAWGHRIKTLKAWLEFLHTYTLAYQCEEIETAVNGRTVHLVCGDTSPGKGVDMLCTIISAKLQMNPFCGDVFAFCSYDKIKYMHWDGGGFQVVSRRREYGRYFWPPVEFGKIVALSALEFEYILRGCEQI
jgi:hypothetical protein